MKSQDYANYRNKFFADISDMSDLKRIEYTVGNQDDDVFTNFRSIGDRLGIDPKIVLSIYLLKHMDSIRSYLKHGQTFTEDISGRIADAINYLVLLNGLIEVEKEDNHKRKSDNKNLVGTKRTEIGQVVNGK